MARGCTVALLAALFLVYIAGTHASAQGRRLLANASASSSATAGAGGSGCNSSAAASASAVAKALGGGDVTAGAKALANAYSKGCATTIAEGAAQAYSSDKSASGLYAATLAYAISNATAQAPFAVASGIGQAAQAGNSGYTSALASGIAYALTEGGSVAEAVAKATSYAIDKYGCSTIKPLLAAAKADAEAAGKGSAYASSAAQSSTVSSCAGGSAPSSPTPSSSSSSGGIPANDVSKSNVNVVGGPAHASNTAVGTKSAVADSTATSESGR